MRKRQLLSLLSHSTVRASRLNTALLTWTFQLGLQGNRHLTRSQSSFLPFPRKPAQLSGQRAPSADGWYHNKMLGDRQGGGERERDREGEEEERDSDMISVF